MNSLERLLRPLRRELSAELADALLRLKADTEMQARYDELAGKNTEGALSAEEWAELDSLVRANSILSLLKAEARAFLQQPKAA
jgi:CRISPR/Cas system-associated endonuclease Cas1